MAYVVDFVDVSTVGLESSPVAEALAGLRANEARYFTRTYDHDFTVVQAVRGHGGPGRAGLLQVRAAEVDARGHDPRLVATATSWSSSLSRWSNTATYAWNCRWMSSRLLPLVSGTRLAMNHRATRPIAA